MIKRSRSTTLGGSSRSVGAAGYVVFLIAICFFSGVFGKVSGPMRFLDFNNLLGEFGKITQDAMPGFQGQGGTGVRAGFLHGLSIAPSVCFSIAVISLVDRLGGLAAAERMLSPIMRIIMGVPGNSTLAIIASWQSSDTGAALTRDLYEKGQINDDERDILVAYQFSAGATLGLYFAHAAILFPFLTKPVGLALLVQMVVKVLGGNLMRAYAIWDARRGKSAAKVPEGGKRLV